MSWFGSKSVRTRVILIQGLILVGVIAWFVIFLPRIEKERAAARVAERETKITAFLQSMLIEVGGPDDEPPAKGGGVPAHPQRLKTSASRDEVEGMLGAPDTTYTDFRGGQHLTWVGTRHRLEVVFDKGNLYALTYTDLQTGHGATVFESSAQWSPF